MLNKISAHGKKYVQFLRQERQIYTRVSNILRHFACTVKAVHSHSLISRFGLILKVMCSPASLEMNC